MHFKVRRLTGWGASKEAVQGLARTVLAETQGAVSQWNSSWGHGEGGNHSNVRVRARSVNAWEERERVPESPWPSDPSYLFTDHKGRWRVSSTGESYSEEWTIAMAIGHMRMHWPLAQAEDPGCWAFAAWNPEDPAERRAVTEAMWFADAFTVREADLRRELAANGHNGRFVQIGLQAPMRAIVRQAGVYGIDLPWTHAEAGAAT